MKLFISFEKDNVFTAPYEAIVLFVPKVFGCHNFFNAIPSDVLDGLSFLSKTLPLRGSIPSLMRNTPAG